MKNTLRATFAWLHTWVGLLLGWLLFTIFVTGTATYFRGEITQWMQPELARASSPLSKTLDLALREIRSVSPNPGTIYLVLPEERTPGLWLNWQDATGRHSKMVDAETAKVEARDSRAGEFFYRFHFQLQLPYPWGRWIACFAAVFMMVALVTGIFAHRQFFKDFFTFRPGKGGTRSWLDFHNLSGVVALPFYFMISYTALVMFINMFMPWGTLATQPQAAAQRPAVTTAASAPGPVDSASLSLADWQPMLAEGEKRWGEGNVRFIWAPGLGTPAGTVNLRPGKSIGVAFFDDHGLTFNAATGELLNGDPPASGFVSRLHGVLFGLHLARFAGPALRTLFFFMGLLGTAMVATGLILWTVKRRKRQETLHGPGRYGFGHALVERLNVAVVAGFLIAMASIFWANRLLPIDLAQRGDREVNVVFIVWALAALHAFVRPVARAWKEQLGFGAALFLGIPLLDAFTGPYLREAFARGNGPYLGFLAAVLGIGLLLAIAARRVDFKRRKRPEPEISGARA
jgi:uncharacterized iron-regulated membrane protein